MYKYPVANSRRELPDSPMQRNTFPNGLWGPVLCWTLTERKLSFFPKTHCKQTWQKGALWRSAGIGYHDTFFRNCLNGLGVVLNRNLSWKPYIGLVTKEVNRTIYLLRSMRSWATQKLRQRLVEALVLPHLGYCATVLLDATNEQKIRLQKLQNSCIRYIYGLIQDVHISPYRRRLNWMRTDTRHTYTTSVLL